MCGIVGFFEVNQGKDLSVKTELIKSMARSINHRGPEQNGIFNNLENSLYLAHLRLAIHDLSPTGVQPMHSQCGKYTIVFNGEIYNYKDLKAELVVDEDVFWKGSSDTEVLIEYISRKGIKATLEKLNGMFAFALYNKVKDTLTLARDRFGEKPLYVYNDNRSLAFSSELKPIEIFQPSLTLNHNSIATQLKYSYIPAPYSIYNEVFKLPAGHYLEIDLADIKTCSLEKAIPFWNIHDEIRNAKAEQESDLKGSINKIENALKNSVKLRMDSDVPFGAFLSGGIDSTCIVALMQEQASKPIDTFSIGFNNDNYNEAHHAKEVAKVLGTNHHELYLESKDMLDYIPKLQSIYDEPFADSSQIPTFMVSKFAKKNVTVALTGDSGDELFAGYNRHLLASRLEASFERYPLSLRKTFGSAVTSISPKTYDKLAFFLKLILGNRFDFNRLGDKVHKFAGAFAAKNGFELYKNLISTSVTHRELLLKGRDVNILSKAIFEDENFNTSEKMMIQDTLSYMQHDILTKVDRASMANSLETRVPFLDNDVFRAAWSIPFEHKIYNGQTKYPLRKIISKYVPDTLMKRPKAGFGVPISDWLRGDLREWAESLLSEKSIILSGSMDYNAVQKIWKEHKSGKFNHQYELWNILMLQQWLVNKN
ncbi:asparagine synthase (glutamine-hydrolyzing) [Pseudoalteromonas sp. TB51]|uniref:asparagine synthase (glutamine-hydrolyzing) n=1 Tax=Pseudoalteromonas sp. TB51 TaxID=1055803 RepID=UPI00042A6517|nr:asparagine synthase (glutamine-hydrolyzing) [Pseudoalteromonas sp. TB51]